MSTLNNKTSETAAAMEVFGAKTSEFFAEMKVSYSEGHLKSYQRAERKYSVISRGTSIKSAKATKIAFKAKTRAEAVQKTVPVKRKQTLTAQDNYSSASADGKDLSGYNREINRAQGKETRATNFAKFTKTESKFMSSIAKHRLNIANAMEKLVTDIQSKTVKSMEQLEAATINKINKTTERFDAEMKLESIKIENSREPKFGDSFGMRNLEYLAVQRGTLVTPLDQVKLHVS